MNCLAHLLSVSMNHVTVKTQAIHSQRDAAAKMNSDTSFPTIFGGHMWQTFWAFFYHSQAETTLVLQGDKKEIVLR